MITPLYVPNIINARIMAIIHLISSFFPFNSSTKKCNQNKRK
ncbi:unknown [Methanothermobacter thermautotrophicus str. Delta H]|uniref:Uncharacterized protein n=1 Tax=Methanothermobacter thermautotrophicus (strain ATCC 29096 / DSM 1053 / JCM 10044 / NBRC 100330 / Delta H) TaxID=187420 RepID=O26188_METTH|nr:unknown [Methanothermobacter thermautotrophicus str. Delta H]